MRTRELRRDEEEKVVVEAKEEARDERPIVAAMR